MKITGPVSYHVRLADGRVRRCHQDQLRARGGDEEETEAMPNHTPEENESIPMTSTNPEDSETTDDPHSEPLETRPPIPAATPTPTIVPERSSPPTRYPRRDQKKRTHFEPQHT